MALLHFLEKERPEGQATFEMANLRPKDTNLPFVVWVSQRDNFQHDIRVKVGNSPKLLPNQMGSYSVRPFAHVAGPSLSTKDENLLEDWIKKNIDVIVSYWDGSIAYTADLMDQLVPV